MVKLVFNPKKENNTSLSSLVSKKIEHNLNPLKDLSIELKNDKDIIRESIIKNWRSFEFVNEILKNDVSFVKECIEINGQIFEFVSDEIKGKRDLCLFAICKELSVEQSSRKTISALNPRMAAIALSIQSPKY